MAHVCNIKLIDYLKMGQTFQYILVINVVLVLLSQEIKPLLLSGIFKNQISEKC